MLLREIYLVIAYDHFLNLGKCKINIGVKLKFIIILQSAKMKVNSWQIQTNREDSIAYGATPQEQE